MKVLEIGYNVNVSCWTFTVVEYILNTLKPLLEFKMFIFLSIMVPFLNQSEYQYLSFKTNLLMGYKLRSNKSWYHSYTAVVSLM